MFYPRTQAGKGGPGLEVWRHREIQGISWDLALLGEVQEGSGESEGSDTRRRSLRKNIPCRGIALLMALGPRSHQARACFDIPHGEEWTGAAAVSHSLVGCLSQGLRGPGGLCRK